MKIRHLFFFVLAMNLFGVPAFSQSGASTAKDTTLLGLPGDNLDLYAVIDLFRKSKTIEDFEKALNEEKTGINNLDLDLDKKVDFIKVVTKKNGEDFTFILQVDVNKTEKHDVAVIMVSKDKDKKVTMQIVGDKALYGEGYIVEPKSTTTPAVTANPGYTGDNPVVVSVPATTTVVVVESAPIVQYVYSPAYVPYYPPYYYGYYPPYYAAFSVMAVGIYCANHSYYHGGYGYHGNTTVIHNTNNYNNYNNSRNTSNTVNHNKASGNYNGNRSSAGNTASTRPSNGSSASKGQTGGASAGTHQSGGSSALSNQVNSSYNSQQSRSGASSQQSRSGASSQQSRSGSSGSYGSRGGGGGSSYSGGGSSRSSSDSRGGGGGGSRGGGGGGGRGGGGRR